MIIGGGVKGQSLLLELVELVDKADSPNQLQHTAKAKRLKWKGGKQMRGHRSVKLVLFESCHPWLKANPGQ